AVGPLAHRLGQRGSVEECRNCDHRNDPRVWHRSSLSSQHVPTSWLTRLPSEAITSRHPPAYSITSSARASNVGGTSRPSAFAVLRLITKLYLVGVCTGRSAGSRP